MSVRSPSEILFVNTAVKEYLKTHGSKNEEESRKDVIRMVNYFLQNGLFYRAIVLMKMTAMSAADRSALLVFYANNTILAPNSESDASFIDLLLYFTDQSTPQRSSTHDNALWSIVMKHRSATGVSVLIYRKVMFGIEPNCANYISPRVILCLLCTFGNVRDVSDFLEYAKPELPALVMNSTTWMIEPQDFVCESIDIIALLLARKMNYSCHV